VVHKRDNNSIQFITWHGDSKMTGKQKKRLKNTVDILKEQERIARHKIENSKREIREHLINCICSIKDLQLRDRLLEMIRKGKEPQEVIKHLKFIEELEYANKSYLRYKRSTC
jgi:hypothetical protein